MSMNKTITGVSTFQNFEGGFWGIVTEEEDYLPIDMPEQLKVNDANITCVIQVDEDLFSKYGWGIPCHIISFSTI